MFWSPMKSSMFFLFFVICFAANYFFFTEDIIHKIYEQGGKYDILFFLPTISISFSIHHILKDKKFQNKQVLKVMMFYIV